MYGNIWPKLSILILLALYAITPRLVQADVPEPPVDVVASDGQSVSSVSVSWNAPASGDTPSTYKIFRSLSNSHCSGVAVGTVNHPTTLYVDTGVTPTTIYYYSVKSVGVDGESICSSTDSGYAGTLPPPLEPNNVQATNNLLDKITVTWTIPVGSQPIEAFRIYRATTQSFCLGGVLAETSASATSFDDTTAVPGQLYYYSMKSSGPTGVSRCSQINDGARLEPPPPLPPTSVVASDGTSVTSVTVAWNAPTSGQAVSHYNLYRSNSDTLCGDLHAANISAGATSYVDTTNVVSGAQYFYSLVSVGASGDSVCSNSESGFAKIGSPRSITASDGDDEDRVQVNWLAPTSGGNLTGYDLYRSTSSEFCGDILEANLSAATLSYTDTNVIPGQTYFYSLKSKSQTGDSDCSTKDSGFAFVAGPQNMRATDGVFLDRIQISWDRPPGTLPVIRYLLYRDTSPTSCRSILRDNVRSVSTIFDDTHKSGVQGVPFYYSMRAETSLGLTPCSNIDSGFARTPLPACQNGIDDDGDGFTDLNDPGCLNDSGRSSERYINGPACDNGLDDDGDGKEDFTETLLIGIGDPGCESVDDVSEDDNEISLQSGACAKFNTFFGQANIAEFRNPSDSSRKLSLTMYNLGGEQMISRDYTVTARNQIDIGIHDLLKEACEKGNTASCSNFVDISAEEASSGAAVAVDGVVDTYGLLCVDFNDSVPANERIGALMSLYRPSADGLAFGDQNKQFSFAMGSRFTNARVGAKYAVTNTYDAQGMGNPVFNWGELVNHSEEAERFTVSLYNQRAELVDQRRVRLAPRAEFDVEVGHQIVDASGETVEDVYVVKAEADDPDAKFTFQVARYSTNGGVGSAQEFTYALTLEGQQGTSETLFAPITNQLAGITGLKEDLSVSNWLEVAAVGDSAARVRVTFFNNSGGEIASSTDVIAAKTQKHYNAGALLSAKSSGSVSIEVLDGRVISQSMHYVHGSGNNIVTAFASPAKPLGRANQSGSINTFLRNQNAIVAVSTQQTPVDVAFTIKQFNGVESSGVLGLSAQGSNEIEVKNDPSFNLPDDVYAGFFTNSSTAGAVRLEIRRARVTASGFLDYIRPIPVE